jgi:hypothetical protein
MALEEEVYLSIQKWGVRVLGWVLIDLEWVLEKVLWALEMGLWVQEKDLWVLEMGSWDLEMGSWDQEVDSWDLEMALWVLAILLEVLLGLVEVSRRLDILVDQDLILEVSLYTKSSLSLFLLVRSFSSFLYFEKTVVEFNCVLVFLIITLVSA